jgi:two-component system, OmpR family, phosphate regulon sensor histidine kinase PhoR
MKPALSPNKPLRSKLRKALLLRGALWLAALFASVALCAWYWGWAAGCGVALAWCAASTVWHLAQLHQLLSTLQQPANHLAPTATGVWGEVFYWLHRHNRRHALALAQLQEQQTRFTQAIHASPNACVMLDDAGRVAWLNAAAQALLGLEPARDIGQNLAVLLRTPAVAALLDSTRSAAPIQLHHQGRTVIVQAFAFGDAHTLLLGQDVTELERTERVRRDFVANVSHELRTPLTVLAGYAELLHDHREQLPPALQDATLHLLAHSQRMSQLTQDLLQLAALESSLPVASVETIPAVQWFDWAAQAYAPLAQQAGIAFSVTAPDAAWQLRGPLAALHSALGNVLSNAIRYTPRGGSVWLHAAAVQGACHITVRDTGCGIAPEHLPRLTERFYRVSASRSRDQGGTGLGLAIVKHLMQAQGGELRIHSELGLGSSFVLVLPLVST